MQHIEQHPWALAYIQRVQDGRLPQPLPDDATVPTAVLAQIFQSMLQSRLLDLRSRLMQAKGQSFYTIGSSGHEANAAVAAALRVTDPAFLHYRSGAFFIERSKQLPGSTPLYDMLLSFAASSDDPISGGRHKVLGSLALSVPPQTSTIASHLPKAVGTAFAIDLSQRLGFSGQWPEQAIALCSFGDASANHSTAQGAINAACWADYQHVPVPVLFLCEDNGLGISTPTPCGWIRHSLAPHMQTFSADSRDLPAVYQAAQQAVAFVRTERRPALLHLKTVRLFGHAGADAEVAYRKKEQIEGELEQDPLLYATALLLARGSCTAAQLAAQISALDLQIGRVAQQASSRPKLTSAAAVMQSIVPPAAERPLPVAKARGQALAFDKHNLGKPQHLAKLLNWTLHEILAQYPNTLLMGEDVGKKGGVYGVTQQLVQQYGPNRVINTLLDEQSILGLGIGLAQQGFLPMPEIQFLAYVHNAEDQIRGEAATLPFFSNGQYQNPMVVRIAGLGYQRGFGGHFHNDNSFAVFRDIPSLLLLCPSNGYDASLLLRQAVQLAHQHNRLVVFLEPIALYMTRDLHQAGDNLWAREMPAIETPLPEFGTPAVAEAPAGEADLTIISYANGFFLSMQAQKQLAEQGIQARVLDLRYLIPLQLDAIVRTLGDARKVLIVDECRQRGSLSEELFTGLHEKKPGHYLLSRLCAEDSFIPLGAAAYTVLPSVAQIIEKAKALHALQAQTEGAL